MATSFFLDLNAPDFQEKMTAMYKSLDGEDPLLCALVGTAHIDKCLISLLDLFMIPGTTRDKHLTNPKYGILTGLNERAEFAYLLGMISSTTLRTINTIASIRNAFAHSHVPLTFDSNDVAKYCKDIRLTEPRQTVSDIQDPGFNEWFNSNRSKFVRAITETIMTLARVPQQLTRPNTPFIEGESSD
jgi:hypothetical protein